MERKIIIKNKDSSNRIKIIKPILVKKIHFKKYYMQKFEEN